MNRTLERLAAVLKTGEGQDTEPDESEPEGFSDEDVESPDKRTLIALNKQFVESLKAQGVKWRDPSSVSIDRNNGHISDLPKGHPLVHYAWGGFTIYVGIDQENQAHAHVEAKYMPKELLLTTKRLEAIRDPTEVLKLVGELIQKDQSAKSRMTGPHVWWNKN